MISRKRLALAAAGFAAVGAVAAAGAGSSPPGPGEFTNVPFANARDAGVAPANALSPELADVVAAQGSMKLENGTAAVPYYGYDGNGTMVPAARLERRGVEDGARQEHVPRLRARPQGRRRELQLRHPLPLPGPRDRHGRVHHADQPRRRPGAPDHAARPRRTRPARRCRPSTAPPGTRGRSSSCSRPRAAEARRVRDRPGLPVDGHEPRRLARPRRPTRASRTTRSAT